MEHFEQGREFHTYKDLLAAKRRYEQDTKTLLTTKSSAKYAANDPRKEDLIYARIQYQCKAGEERKSTSKGNRAVSTGKMNCPVLVTIRAKEEKLCVHSSILQHANHTQDTETFMKYPENLRLKPHEIRYAKELLKKGLYKKAIKAKLKEKRGGLPVSSKFWAQIQRSMKKNESDGNDNDSNNDDFADDTFDTSLPSESLQLTPDIDVVKQEIDAVVDTDDHHTSDDDNDNDNDDDDDDDDRNGGHNGSGDPLSDMFQKCATDDSANHRTNDKIKTDFDKWFKDLIPGEKLSYNEWLWQLEFNFPSLDKLNFIKYGIILGMTILNKYYFDGSMKIDGNGIKEVDAEFGRKRKRYLRPTVPVNKSVEAEDEEEEDDDDDNNDDVCFDNENHDHTPNDSDIEPMVGANSETPKFQVTQDSSSTSTVTPQTHSDSAAKSNDPIKCKMCPEVFPTHSQLYHHMCKFHTGHIGLNCPICNKRFQYERNLNQHIALVHVDNAPNSADIEAGRSICEICGASFDKISSLRSHVRYVHSLEKFYCQYCNRKLSSKKSLREHIQFQHELTFVTHECEECQRIFKYKSSYRMHMKKQHNIRFA